MMRSAWCVGVTATSVLLMASTALAQSFCSDLDPLVKLAPSGFRSILDDANGGPLANRGARTLPRPSPGWCGEGVAAPLCGAEGPAAPIGRQGQQSGIRRGPW